MGNSSLHSLSAAPPLLSEAVCPHLLELLLPGSPMAFSVLPHQCESPLTSPLLPYASHLWVSITTVLLLSCCSGCTLLGLVYSLSFLFPPYMLVFPQGLPLAFLLHILPGVNHYFCAADARISVSKPGLSPELQSLIVKYRLDISAWILPGSSNPSTLRLNLLVIPYSPSQ